MPRISLAAEAGLEVTDGIVTTAALRTSDPDIFAAATSLARTIRCSAVISASSTGLTR